MASLSKMFILASVFIVLALPLASVGILILALPMGLVGGFLLIKEMVKQYFK
jgi:hypothetical protein